MPFPSPGFLPNPGIKPRSPSLQADCIPSKPPGEINCCLVDKLCLTLHDPMDCIISAFPVPHHFLEFAQVLVHQICDAIQPSHALSPSSPSASVFPSMRVFSNELALCVRWPKYWSFSFNISPSKDYSGLISFKIDWFDFLAVQGSLRSLLQHHSLKASILQCSAFFIVQLSHLYTTTGKDHILDYMDLCLQSDVFGFSHTV